MIPAELETVDLMVERTVDATAAEIFDLWIDPSSAGSPWFGSARAIVHPFVDGLFYHLVQFDGQDWAHYGRFVVLERPHRIEHTWVSRATQGLESVVSLTLRPVTGATLIELRHRNLPADSVGRQHKNGWEAALDAIAKKFASRKTSESRAWVVERRYRAQVDDLWGLWTSISGFESWWGPEGFRVAVRTLDARVGGVLEYEMIADGPDQIAAIARMGRPRSHDTRARYTELTPRRRLALTHLIDFVPGVSPYESTMVVEFVESSDDVRMIVTGNPMHDDEFTKMSMMGFTSQLSKLDERFKRIGP